MSQLSLGAINKLTGEYVYPKIANKKDEYICPECNKDLILVQGEIRVHHFRHKVDSINPCHHYNKPTESQIHKDAKMLMKKLLENKTPIQFVRECVSCKKSNELNIPKITEGSIISLEHRFNYNDELKIADVAHTINGEIKSIYEICNTHKTCSENRPEPWVEIDANSLLILVNTTENQPLIINCIRCEKCVSCKFNNFIKDKFSFITNISSLFKIEFQEKNYNNILISNKFDTARILNMTFYEIIEGNKIKCNDEDLMSLVWVNCEKNFNADEINIINKYNITNLEDYIRSSIKCKNQVLSAYKQLNIKKGKIIDDAQDTKLGIPFSLDMLGINIVVRFDMYLFRIRICGDKNKTIKYIESYGLICERCDGTGYDESGNCLICNVDDDDDNYHSKKHNVNYDTTTIDDIYKLSVLVKGDMRCDLCNTNISCGDKVGRFKYSGDISFCEKCFIDKMNYIFITTKMSMNPILEKSNLLYMCMQSDIEEYNDIPLTSLIMIDCENNFDKEEKFVINELKIHNIEDLIRNDKISKHDKQRCLKCFDYVRHKYELIGVEPSNGHNVIQIEKYAIDIRILSNGTIKYCKSLGEKSVVKDFTTLQIGI